MIGDTASCTGVRTPFHFCLLLRGYSLALLILTHFLRWSMAAEIYTYSGSVVDLFLCHGMQLAKCGRQTLSQKGFHVWWFGALDQIDGCFSVRHRWVDWWLRCLLILLQANVLTEQPHLKKMGTNGAALVKCSLAHKSVTGALIWVESLPKTIW